MNLQETYRFMEQNSLSDQNRLDTLIALAKDTNSPHYPLEKDLNNERKYCRVFLAATMNANSIAKLARQGFQDKVFPALFCHCLLIRASGEDTLTDNMAINLVDLIYHHKALFNSPGTTLGYAIGYVIGKTLFSGQNSNHFIKLCSDKFIIDQDLFLKGVKKGFSGEARGLLFDHFYKSSFTQRYQDEWSESSRQICYQVLQVSATSKIRSHYTVNPLNEKMTWFLNGMYPEEKTLANIYLEHQNPVQIVYSNSSSEDGALKETVPIESFPDKLQDRLNKFL